MASWVAALLFAGCWQRSWSQGKLEHAGENCFFKCWRLPGYCDWCGAGNACCKAGDHDDDPPECRGPLTYSAQAQGQYHECVVPSFFPGQAPPNELHNVGQLHQLSQAQCISYMAKTGCDWTSEYSCPNQPMGWKGEASPDNSIGYKCCCSNGLWSQTATRGNDPAPNGGLVQNAQCGNYMQDTGCGWTQEHTCPGQPPTPQRKGDAGNDGSLGYRCCCINGFWQDSVSTTFYDPNAFNVDHGMGDEVFTSTLIPTNQDSGFAMHVAPGEQHGTGVANPATDPEFYDSHHGVNTRVDTVHAVFSDGFQPTAHHGAIHNEFSNNNDKAKRERCTFGICADLDDNNPDQADEEFATYHGVRHQKAAGKELPGYKVKIGEDGKPDVKQIYQGVETDITRRRRRRRRRRKSTGPSFRGAAVSSTLLTMVPAGSSSLTVRDQSGFMIGDSVLVGGTERVTVVGFGSLQVSPPVVGTYPAGTPVTKVTGAPAIAARTGAAPAAATDDEKSSSSTSSTGKGGWVAAIVITLCLFFSCLGAVGLYVMSAKPKKKAKKSTDREAYLKNDFVERQPVYTDAPPPQEESQPMLQAEPEVAEVVLPPLAPTQSFPLQTGLPPTTFVPTTTSYVAGTAPSGVSFPGMPTLGGSTYLPGVASAGTVLPPGYGGSTYLAGPQLGVTTGLTSFPQYR